MRNKKLISKFPVTRLRTGIAQIGLILGVLYIIAKFNYLLFHVLAEFFGAAIGLAIFLLTWNARKFARNNYFLFFGMAFFVSGIISLIHTLTYRGMGVVAGTANDSNVATQLWLANQYIVAVTFVVAPFLFGKKIKTQSILLGYLAALVFFLVAIFYWKIFPAAYTEGIGLTPFKKISEYAVATVYALSFYFFWKRRNLFEKRVIHLLSFTLFLFFVSTIFFTLYVGVYSFPNEIGHLLRVLAFYVSYLALVEFGLMRPYHSMFRELSENEKTLKTAKEEWEKTFDSVPDLIAILDAKHEIIRANKAMAQRLGTNTEKCVGLNCYKCVHGSSKPIDSCPHSLTLKDGKEHIAEVEEKNLGGTFLVSTTPLFGKDGKLTGSVHVARDITERKKAEEKIANLAKFPEENPNPVLRVGQKGILLYANPASRSLLKHWGCKIGQAIPKKWFGATAQSLADERKMEIEEQIEDKTFLFVVTPVRKRKYVNIYGSDITERKKLDQAKDEFISLASHQLRTPLSSISLSSELLLRGISGKIEGQQKDFLEEIHKGTKKMSLLVNNLLNVSRLEMGTFSVEDEPVDILSIIQTKLKESLPIVSEKKLKLEKKMEKDIPLISFDTNCFEIVFDNLLSNAIRYTPKEGKISIELEKNGLHILLKVSDTGFGIPDSQKEKIFEKSFRADNAKRITSEGAGLGLYMVKSIADLTGSKIWFESEENKGTNFYFSTPIK